MRLKNNIKENQTTKHKRNDDIFIYIFSYVIKIISTNTVVRMIVYDILNKSDNHRTKKCKVNNTTCIQ